MVDTRTSDQLKDLKELLSRRSGQIKIAVAYVTETA